MPPENFVVTPYLERLTKRALMYLQAGVPVHLRGPAGTGKTSLAFHLAERLGRPVQVIFGNESYRGLDLAGNLSGKRSRLVVDNFVRRVVKRTEEERPLWTDGRLLKAIRQGGTLIYDEFTRSRPGANNILLSVLEEGVVEVPEPEKGTGLARVHPEFRVIFTSNPEEYAGVHKSTDALRDRMITLDVAGRDFETDVAIVAAQSGLTRPMAEMVLRIAAQRCPGRVSLRPAIMLATVVRHARILPNSQAFDQICQDVLGGE